MAKAKKSKSAAATRKTAPAKASRPAKKTEIRNTTAPRKSSTKPAGRGARSGAITFEMIAQRAYDIHLSGAGGSQDDNWHRAERELRGI